jgi:hypothetical protein
VLGLGRDPRVGLHRRSGAADQPLSPPAHPLPCRSGRRADRRQPTRRARRANHASSGATGSSSGGLVEHRARFRYWLSVGATQRPGSPTGQCLPQ